MLLVSEEEYHLQGEKLNDLRDEVRNNFSITFDDGYYDNLEITRDYLSHLNIKPIVFIVSELLNGNININSPGQGDNFLFLS